MVMYRTVQTKKNGNGYGTPGGNRQEAKCVDTSSATTTAPGGVTMVCNTTGTILCLNQIGPGSGYFQRAGRKVMMKSVRLTGLLQNFGAARTAPGDYLRLMIVYDRQTNGSTPTIANILQNSDSTNLNVSNAICGINLDNRDRFKVVMDKRIFLPCCTNNALGDTTYIAATYNPHYIVDEFRKLNGLDAHYNADVTPPTIAQVATGGLFLLTQTLINASGAENWFFNFNVRLRYLD